MDIETLKKQREARNHTRKLTEALLQKPHVQPKFIALHNAIFELARAIAPSHPDDETFRDELIEAFTSDIESYIKHQMSQGYSKGSLYADLPSGHTGKVDI